MQESVELLNSGLIGALPIKTFGVANSSRVFKYGAWRSCGQGECACRGTACWSGRAARQRWMTGRCARHQARTS